MFTRQWRRCDEQGASCSDIAGASATSYQLTSEDVGSTLRVQVTASNTAGSAQAESAPTAVIVASSGLPSFVSATSANFNSTTFTVPTPAGAQAGDLLLVWTATDSTHAIASPPTGFAQLGTTQNDGTDSSTSVFWRVLQPGDPASVQGSFASNEAGIVGVLAYRDVDQLAPVESFAQQSQGASTSHSTSSITPTGDGRMVVALFGADPGSNPRTGSPDDAPLASERLDAQSGTLGFVYAEDYLQQAAAPVSLDVTLNGNDSTASFVLALRGP